MKSRRESNTEATIAAILAAGRARFGTEGFESASLEDIGSDARVTTGAIYHHFGNKLGLYRAVVEQIESELLACAMSVSDPDPWLKAQRMFAHLIEACAAPEVQRIICLDAPRVLGPEVWREIELKYGYGAMAAAMTKLIEAGILRPYPVELITPIMLALLIEAARVRAKNPALGASAEDIMMVMFGSLRIAPAA